MVFSPRALVSLEQAPLPNNFVAKVARGTAKIMLGLVTLIVLLGYAIFPWRYIGTLEVSQSKLLSLDEVDSKFKGQQLITPLLYRVNFTTEQKIDALRVSDGFGVIYAVLFVCDSKDLFAEEPITQEMEFRADRQRVEYLGVSHLGNGTKQHNYTALFDNRL